ncbi:MAG: hypothetical protein M1318_00795 [Firmicutes bacterium]|nr:hypothetical protein [Bacillota bacterium]
MEQEFVLFQVCFVLGAVALVQDVPPLGLACHVQRVKIGRVHHLPCH